MLVVGEVFYYSFDSSGAYSSYVPDSIISLDYIPEELENCMEGHFRAA